ncbi:MAG: hypothetical protein Q8P50_05610 [Bacillota bacterium]|nr:hypothetical protein [Bacillota bacterium]
MNRSKLIENMRRQPHSVACGDIETVARGLGIRVTQGKKHTKYCRPGKPPLVIPRHDRVKAPYIRKFLVYIEDLVPELKSK